jgi:hypothetical protein
MARIAWGAASGAASTVALTGLRQAMARAGLVGETAPEQVVARLEGLGLLDGWSGGARRALTVAAHFGYGAGTGAVFGLLRAGGREKNGAPSSLSTEAAVGSALGLLAWAAGWTALLPLAGVHRPPWKEDGANVLLPVLDHAFFGAVWGIVLRLSRGR